MFQYRFSSGSSLVINNLEGFRVLITSLLPTEEIRILVDTSVARTIVLPPVSLFPVKNVKITVVDVTGNAASNNITIITTEADTINGLSAYAVAGNYGSVRFEAFSDNAYYVLAGSGGNVAGAVTLLAFDILIPAARVNVLLNDNLEYDVVIAPPTSEGIVYDIHTCNFLLSGGSVGRDGAFPQLGIYGVENINENSICQTNIKFLSDNPLGVVSQGDFKGISNYGQRFIGDGALAGGIYIGNQSGDSYGVTTGDSDLRVFGTYSIKVI